MLFAVRKYDLESETPVINMVATQNDRITEDRHLLRSLDRISFRVNVPMTVFYSS